MVTAADVLHMARALQLARAGLYSTPPNPAVGCVIVRDGSVVGEGHHLRAGEAHAEVQALRAAGEAARGATVYVTLEPCAHQGRTPPCAQALIEAGVARVVAAHEDPNPRVAGAGLARLRSAGVATALGPLAEEARELNRGFICRMTRGRPWVTLKLAATLDGRTALGNGASRWITGEAARSDVQRLRARASAVLSGIGTVLADDPRLTVRDDALAMHGRLPLRVIVDSRLRTPPSAALLQAPGPCLIFKAPAPAAGCEELLRAAGATVESLPVVDGGLDLAAALRRLAALECNEVLVEAGPRLCGALLRAALIDELIVYYAPRVFGDTARGMFALPAIERVEQGPGLQWRDFQPVGADWRATARPVAGEG